MLSECNSQGSSQLVLKSEVVALFRVRIPLILQPYHFLHDFSRNFDFELKWTVTLPFTKLNL